MVAGWGGTASDPAVMTTALESVRGGGGRVLGGVCGVCGGDESVEEEDDDESRDIKFHIDDAFAILVVVLRPA